MGTLLPLLPHDQLRWRATLNKLTGQQAHVAKVPWPPRPPPASGVRRILVVHGDRAVFSTLDGTFTPCGPVGVHGASAEHVAAAAEAGLALDVDVEAAPPYLSGSVRVLDALIWHGRPLWTASTLPEQRSAAAQQLCRQAVAHLKLPAAWTLQLRRGAQQRVTER